MARAALDLDLKRLAEMAGVGINTVNRFEKGGGFQARSVEAIELALEAAGVEFIPENGGGAGVRLRKSIT